MTGMTLQSLLSRIALGEDSSRQFKAGVKNAESLTSEMATFANTGSMVISGHFDPISDRISMESAA
jgi:hypothetical protein